MDVTTGSSIGVKMTIAAIASINVPTTSNSKLIKINVKNGGILASIKEPAIVCGTCSRVSNMPKIEADPIMNNMTDVVITDSTRIVCNVLKLIDRKSVV